MLAVGEYPSVDSGLIRALSRHLEHLKSCPEGGELHQLIDDALIYCREHGYVNGSGIAYLYGLLLAYARDQSRPSAIRIRARLIQQHLSLYLPHPDHVVPVSNAKPAPLAPLQAKSAGEAAGRIAEAPSATVSKHRAPEKSETDPTGMTAMERRVTDKASQAAEAPETPPAALPGKVQNLGELRQVLTSGMDELLREREALSQQLSDANIYLKMIEAEREQLRTELNKVRKRARTNEKSSKKLGLPKRDVLLRQIEAEVERVKRHGNPLALALIDIDDLENIGDQRDHEAAKAALDRYTSEILGSFRSYDLVARYNKDEFAVLLPNTDKENATRALEKIRKRAKESHFSHKGRSYPLPGFGGVLTFYSPGEEPHQMLRRADEALVNLKLRGERQVVIV